MPSVFTACALLPLLVVSSLPSQQADAPHTDEGKNAGRLYEFKIDKPNFVVNGANLSKVEVWIWSTGTGITEPALLGTMKRITAAGKREKWVLGIAPDLLAVEIFATGFDKAGNLVGKKSLPYKGVSELYEALYGNK